MCCNSRIRSSENGGCHPVTPHSLAAAGYAPLLRSLSTVRSPPSFSPLTPCSPRHRHQRPHRFHRAARCPPLPYPRAVLRHPHRRVQSRGRQCQLPAPSITPHIPHPTSHTSHLAFYASNITPLQLYAPDFGGDVSQVRSCSRAPPSTADLCPAPHCFSFSLRCPRMPARLASPRSCARRWIIPPPHNFPLLLPPPSPLFLLLPPPPPFPLRIPAPHHVWSSLQVQNPLFETSNPYQRMCLVAVGAGKANILHQVISNFLTARNMPYGLAAPNPNYFSGTVRPHRPRATGQFAAAAPACHCLRRCCRCRCSARVMLLLLPRPRLSSEQ
jgi:hypothetical protein